MRHSAFLFCTNDTTKKTALLRTAVFFAYSQNKCFTQNNFAQHTHQTPWKIFFLLDSRLTYFQLCFYQKHFSVRLFVHKTVYTSPPATLVQVQRRAHALRRGASLYIPKWRAVQFNFSDQALAGTFCTSVWQSGVPFAQSGFPLSAPHTPHLTPLPQNSGSNIRGGQTGDTPLLFYCVKKTPRPTALCFACI